MPIKTKVVEFQPITPNNGDIKYWDGENWIALPNGELGKVLTSNGPNTAPMWNYFIFPSSSSSSSL